MEIDTLQEWINESRATVFFGGAGVSTESGIPDFRSANGLYMQDSGYQVSAEEIISHHFYKQYPKIFFEYYFEHLVFPEAKPNACHQYLSALERAGHDISVVTQNIDGLHQKAGSQNVYELHGSVWRNYCERDGEEFLYKELKLDDDGIPRCPYDGAIVRPDIVLYEEPLKETVMLQAIRAIQRADLMIVAGTSLSVYPAAGLLGFFNGAHLAVINRTPTALRGEGVLTLTANIGDVFSQLTLP